MEIKHSKPITPGRRFMSFETLDNNRNRPYKPLTSGVSFKAGRDGAGRISVRRKGGRHKRKYRTIDYIRNDNSSPLKVLSVEYDPNRSAHIALVLNDNGQRRYIIAPKDIKRGDVLQAKSRKSAQIGNVMQLGHIPLGTSVHAIELHPNHGAQLVRAAGTEAVVMAKENDYVTIKLPSGEVRAIHKNCRATIGAIGNEQHFNVSLGKAGRARYLGRRPKVRGVAMNPVDHPHGGGEGRTSGGRHPVSPTGKPTKGYRTRKKQKNTSQYIIRRRR